MGFLAVALVVSAVGSLFNLYDTFWWFDKVLHGYAIFCYTLVLALFAYGVVLTGGPRATIAPYPDDRRAGLVMGALWEVAE